MKHIKEDSLFREIVWSLTLLQLKNLNVGNENLLQTEVFFLIFLILNKSVVPPTLVSFPCLPLLFPYQ